MKYHMLRYSLKVSDSLLSGSILEVCVHAIVGDTRSHSFAVLYKRIVLQASVVAVVVLHRYVESICMPLKTFLGIYSLLRVDLGHAVEVLQV